MRRKEFGLILLCLVNAQHPIAQELRRPVVRFYHPTLDHINAKVESREYKKAIDLSLATAEQMSSQGNQEGYIFFMLRAAEIETFEVWKGKGFPDTDILPDYRRARKHLETLSKHAGKFLDNYPYLKANALFTNAVVYEWLDMPDTAELLHDQSLAMRKHLYGEKSKEVADSYLWRGVLYNWGLQRKDLAEENYRTALELQRNFIPESRYELGSVYFGLANIAREKFQFDEAFMFANQYLSLYRDIPYEQAFGFQLLANIYWNQGDFERSLGYRKKAISIFENSNFEEDLIIEFSNLANDLVNLKRYPEAEEVMKKGEQILYTSDVVDPFYSKMLFGNFGDLYRTTKNYSGALKYFNKAIAIAINQYGERNDEVADLYRMRGELFMEQRLFDDALKDYHKMLLAVIPEFSTPDYHKIPEVQYESPYFKNIIAGAFYKGDAFLRWFDHQGNTYHLRLALEHYRHAYHQMLVARQSIGDELSKAFLTSNFQESIENSIVCARMLYRRTENHEFIQDIFYFVELTKYLNVLDALQRAERANNSEVPVALIFELENTRNELSKLQRALSESKRLALSEDSIANLGDDILDLIQKRRELMDQIAGYSEEAAFNPDSIVISITDIQKQLNKDEQILEFFWGSDSIYSISITDTYANIRATVNDSGTDSLLSSIHHMLQGQLSFKPAAIQNYSLSTSAVYDKLFQPEINRKKIIVIPDGSLNLVPVEALVVKHQSDKLSFSDLAYLIYDHEISYAYSSGILFHKARGKEKKIKSVLGFSFSGIPGDNAAVSDDQMVALPGTYKEMEALSHYFKNVTRYIDGDAIKSNFIDQAPRHDLIHLGIHGVGDPEVADNSRLVFRSDGSGSGDLYAYEIYNLKMRASLVVLSACETGLGKRQTGEGILSIARAFSYAGSPSVVMSMWQVNDLFTALLMRDFYKSLSEGNSVSVSLRNSKKKFLAQADEFSSHPANWAAFVLNGQDQSFEGKILPVHILLIIFAMTLVLGYLVVKMTRTFL